MSCDEPAAHTQAGRQNRNMARLNEGVKAMQQREGMIAEEDKRLRRGAARDEISHRTTSSEAARDGTQHAAIFAAAAFLPIRTAARKPAPCHGDSMRAPPMRHTPFRAPTAIR